jgi:hypothetical protein
MNLYAIDKNGNEILMTKDHIVPKSKGGANALYNYQPMCSHCNAEKADVMPKGVNPKTQQKHTKEELDNEVNKLKSMLGGKDATISNLTRDKDTMVKELAQLKVENAILRKRVKQLAEILSNP